MRNGLVLVLQMIILLVSLPLAGQDTIPPLHISLSPKNRTVNQVLDEITLQTGYNFTYNAALISGKKRVQLEFNGLTLEAALDSLLQNPQFDYRVIGRNIVIYKKNDQPAFPVVEEIDRAILHGRVVDYKSGKPLAYATIALLGTSLGTITNGSGQFSFKIPTNLTDPILGISFMGYKSILLPISYPIEMELTIKLKKETIPLQEVIIRFTDPVKILSDAIDRIGDNYMQEHAAMKGFYRESVKRDDHFMVYSEAVLDVAKGPYSSHSSLDQASIYRGRKITDLASEDTVIIKLRSGIDASLSLDVIKTRPDFLMGDFSELYDLEFTDMMTYDKRRVYVISFRQKSHINYLLFQGLIYIDQENLAILAVDFEFNPELIHKEPGIFLVSRSPHIHIRPIKAKYHVDYRPTDGKYHVSQVRAEVELKVRKRRRWIGSNYQIAIESAITDVVPGERIRINSADRVKPNTILSDQPFQFDPLFWGIHNTIQPEATLLESLKSIEHNIQEISLH